jgi:hypothetical protein
MHTTGLKNVQLWQAAQPNTLGERAVQLCSCANGACPLQRLGEMAHLAMLCPDMVVAALEGEGGTVQPCLFAQQKHHS